MDAALPVVPSAQANLLAGAVHPVMSSSNPSAMLEIKILVTSQMVRGNNHVGQAEKLTEVISGYPYSEKTGDEALRQRHSRLSVPRD